MPRKPGPKTLAGKARSSRNATTHGFFSSQVLLEGEDPAELDAHLARVHAYFNPVGDLEALLVDRIAAGMWRFRRALMIESATMDKTYADVLPLDDSLPAAVREQRALICSVNNAWLDNTHRYAISIERQTYRAIKELKAIQASRRALEFLSSNDPAV